METQQITYKQCRTMVLWPRMSPELALSCDPAASKFPTFSAFGYQAVGMDLRISTELSRTAFLVFPITSWLQTKFFMTIDYIICQFHQSNSKSWRFYVYFWHVTFSPPEFVYLTYFSHTFLSFSPFIKFPIFQALFANRPLQSQLCRTR